MDTLKWTRRKVRCLTMIGALCFCMWCVESAVAVSAERNKFPTKMIRVIVPSPAGASIDMEPRGFVAYLSKNLGVDLIIENIPGAGGKIGLTKVWKADPNGYTLIYHPIPQSIMNEYLFNTEFKISGFTHVFGLFTTNVVLLVHPDNWKTMEEFIKVAREKPLSGGIPSPGSTSHILGLDSVDRLGIKVNWVIYEGSAEVISNLAGKHLDFAIISTNSAQPMVAAGKVRPIFVYSEEPDKIFPNVPYPSKLGYNLVTMAAVRGFLAPPNTPADRVKILEESMLKTAKDPVFVDWAKQRKFEVTPLVGSKYLAVTQQHYMIIEKYKGLFKSK
jgi:tripartite-type tricarboxylate transporter receptor subunit TctC